MITKMHSLSFKHAFICLHNISIYCASLKINKMYLYLKGISDPCSFILQMFSCKFFFYIDINA